MNTNTGKLVFELKQAIKVIDKRAPEPIEVTELVISEPNRYNLDEFYDFQSLGLELFRKALEKAKKSGEVVATPDKEAATETSNKDVAQMVRMLVFSSYSEIKPSVFLAAFKKAVFCKGHSYISSMDVEITEHQFMNAHRDDIAQLACEYFAFFAISGFMD